MSEFIIRNGELYHHGVKGMKWGVRKSDPRTKEIQEKRVAYKKARQEYNRSFNKASARGRAAWSPIKRRRDANLKRWEDASDKAKKLETAKKEYDEARGRTVDKAAKKPKQSRRVADAVAKGHGKTAKVLSKVGTAFLVDQAFYGGAGTKLAGKAIKTAGMATITAYKMSKGDTDIRWYDKKGNRVG
jgi:hypothetical protein